MVELNIGIYLRSDDIKDEDELEFTDEGEESIIKKKDGSEGKIFSISIVLPSGEPRTWTMNLTSQRAVATKLGTDTKKWVGRKVRVYKLKQNIQGIIKDVIYARSV